MMQPYALASVATAAVATAAFARLAMQTKKSADRRRATCISAMLACLLIVVGGLIPEAWRPDVPVVSSLPQPVARMAHPVYEALYPAPPAPTAYPQPASLRTADPAPTTAVGLGAYVAAGAIFVGTWWCLGLIGAFRFLRRSRSAPEEIRSLSRYRIRLVEDLRIPACVGGLRPTVLLPEKLLEKDPWELQAVIRHEEAHIAAGDHAWLALAYALCALQWFNPLAWLLLKRFKFESELAADDAVLLDGCRPSGYAGLLAHFETEPVPKTSAMLAPMLTGRGSLAKRLHAILSTTNRRTLMNHRQRIRTVVIAALGGTVLAVLIAARPAGEYLRWDSAKVSDIPAIRAIMPSSEARRVELVQVGTKDDAKGPVFWDTSGNIIPSGQAISHDWRSNDVNRFGAIQRWRHIVFRVEAQPTDTDPESCVGSPASRQEEFPAGAGKGYASSDYLMTRDGWHYFVDHISYDPIGTMQQVTDEKGRSRLVEVSPPATKDFGWKHFGPTSVGVSVTLDAPKEIGSVSTGYSPGKIILMTPGVKFPKGFTRPSSWKSWTELRFDMPIVQSGFVSFRPVTTDGRVLSDDWIMGNFGSGYTAGDKTQTALYLVGLPKDQIKDLKVYFRPTISGDLTDIPMSPKETVKP